MTTMPADSPPRSIAEQRDQLNRAIAWHYAQLSILKAQVNALSAISRLPNELLGKIFGFYAFLYHPPFDLRWTKVMLVCRRWHEIAVAEQWLWSFVQDSLASYSVKSMQRIFAQLGRSGAAPLTLDFTSTNADFHPEIYLPHAERIRDLKLSGEAMYAIRFTHLLSTYPLPLLRSVKLEAGKWDAIPEGEPNALPEALFDGRAPRLTELDLKQAGLSWCHLRGLTKLSLESVLDTVQPGLSILSVLVASPALAYLRLDLVLAADMLSAPRQSVSLPVLEYLSLRDPVELCTELLRHLVIPPSARLLVYGLGIRAGRDITEILVLLRKHIRHPASPIIRCLQLDSKGHPSGAYLRLSAFTATSRPDPRTEEDDGSFTINTHPQTGHALRQIMRKVIKTLPHTAITHLDTSGVMTFSRASWKAAFALLPALEMIYALGGQGAVTLFDALTDLTGIQPKVSSRDPFLLHLRQIHLRVYWWGRSDDNDEDQLAGLWDALARLALIRIESGSKLAVLEIEERGQGFSLTDEQWDVLFERVGKLVRDGNVYDPVVWRQMLEEWNRRMEAIRANNAVQ